jgi:uncharacterized cupredoxin-like copper-binding protein
MSHRRVVAMAVVVAGIAAAATGGVSGAASSKTRKVTLSAKEYRFSKSHLTTTAHRLRVTLDNKGAKEHEFVVIRTKRKVDALPIKHNEASEHGSVGEIDDVKAGASKSHTFKLKPGRYVFICNVEGHYKRGMYGTLTVK